MSASACAIFFGSSLSSLFIGLPVLTAQNLQPRVQTSPITMKVAVPLFQHSEIFGQCADSQTVCNLCLFNEFLISEKLSFLTNLIFSHSGLINCWCIFCFNFLFALDCFTS